MGGRVSFDGRLVTDRRVAGLVDSGRGFFGRSRHIVLTLFFLSLPSSKGLGLRCVHRFIWGGAFSFLTSSLLSFISDHCSIRSGALHWAVLCIVRYVRCDVYGAMCTVRYVRCDVRSI